MLAVMFGKSLEVVELLCAHGSNPLLINQVCTPRRVPFQQVSGRIVRFNVAGGDSYERSYLSFAAFQS